MISAAVIWERIRHRPNVPRAYVEIPAGQVLTKLPQPNAVQPNKNYFAVIVDELFLADARQWRKTYDPMVLAITEFTHAGKDTTLPFVVGPTLLGNIPGTKVRAVPEGMLYRGTGVAGLHPFRGGKVTSTMVLCQVQRNDHARDVLKVVESVAGAVPFGHELGTYTKLTGTLLDGMDTLLGLQETMPLVGVRKEFPYDLGEAVRNAYYALIDGPEQDYPMSQLWVRDGGLLKGPDEKRLKAVRTASYVLFSTRVAPTTSDVTKLPQAAVAESLVKRAVSKDDRDWKSVKSELLVLYRDLLTAPALTRDQAKAWYKEIETEVVEAHQAAAAILNLGPEETAVRDELRDAVSILDLE
jgi:hypothetical protein